jgi:hypothetical protein
MGLCAQLPEHRDTDADTHVAPRALPADYATSLPARQGSSTLR